MIMLRSAMAIAGIIGVAAISHRLLRHYLTSTKSQIPKPESQDKKKNKAGCTEQEAMMSDSDGIDVPLCCILNDVYTLYKLWEELACYEGKCMLESHCYERRPLFERQAKTSTSNAFDALELRKPILEDVMKGLADPNTHLIGVHGFHNDIKDTLLEKVYRRVQRDQLFGMVVTVTVSKKSDARKVQEEIARQLGLTFSHKSKNERAQELFERIKIEHKILIILCDIHKGRDLGKVGIMHGSDHAGCKILLTSTSEHVLSNHMLAHKTFMV